MLRPPSITYDEHFRRNWVGFFLLGLCNILPYGMVSAAANSIARSYHKEGFVATVYGSMGSTTIMIRVLNTFFLSRVSYNIRFGTNALLLVLGIAGVAFAPNFIAAIFAVVFVGASYVFGENLALGYLSRFDSRLVNAWSSGSGFAGLLGALFIISAGCLVQPTSDIAHDLKIINWYSFLACCPFVFLYLVAYFIVICEPNEERGRYTQVNAHRINADTPYEDEDGNSYIESAETDPLLAAATEDMVAGEARRRTMRDTWRCFKLIWKLSVNLAVTMFASYVCRVAAAKTENGTKYDQDCPEFYASLQLCFQAANFASMSSVQHLKIRRVEILTAFQVVNAAIWGADTVFKFLPVYILPSYMIIVGLIMGAVYVNTFYMVLNDEQYPDPDRDLLANMTATFITIGISLSSILMTVLYKTVLVNF